VTPRARRVGATALLLEMDGPDDVRALHAELLRRRAAHELPSTAEIVPGLCTILVDGVTDPDGLARGMKGWRVPTVGPLDGPLVEIPTVYDGADLAQVAQWWRMTTDEVIATHTAIEHRVAFLGFAPGFAYLIGLPDHLQVPRLPTPRPSVSAGAVALADCFCGIYPRETPGGWQLIGRTAVVLWDAARPEPALLTPGARVRFVAVG
jgi:KipI family sensor histidine kinase inhibitor